MSGAIHNVDITMATLGELIMPASSLSAGSPRHGGGGGNSEAPSAPGGAATPAAESAESPTAVSSDGGGRLFSVAVKRLRGIKPKAASSTAGAVDSKRDRATTARKALERKGGRNTSRFRGVTHHIRTGRWEAHIWEDGKQVYLGGFDSEEQAALAYDIAAIKCRGVEAVVNYDLANYAPELQNMEQISKEELILSLRKQSKGATRVSSSQYRGVTKHQKGKWEARIGQLVGRKYKYLGLYESEIEAAMAYDRESIRQRGCNASTNFALTLYTEILTPEQLEELQQSSEFMRDFNSNVTGARGGGGSGAAAADSCGGEREVSPLVDQRTRAGLAGAMAPTVTTAFGRGVITTTFGRGVKRGGTRGAASNKRDNANDDAALQRTASFPDAGAPRVPTHGAYLQRLGESIKNTVSKNQDLLRLDASSMGFQGMRRSSSFGMALPAPLGSTLPPVPHPRHLYSSTADVGVRDNRSFEALLYGRTTLGGRDIFNPRDTYAAPDAMTSYHRAIEPSPPLPLFTTSFDAGYSNRQDFAPVLFIRPVDTASAGDGSTLVYGGTRQYDGGLRQYDSIRRGSGGGGGGGGGAAAAADALIFGSMSSEGDAHNNIYHGLFNAGAEAFAAVHPAHPDEPYTSMMAALRGEPHSSNSARVFNGLANTAVAGPFGAAGGAAATAVGRVGGGSRQGGDGSGGSGMMDSMQAVAADGTANAGGGTLVHTQSAPVKEFQNLSLQRRASSRHLQLENVAPQIVVDATMDMCYTNFLNDTNDKPSPSGGGRDGSGRDGGMVDLLRPAPGHVTDACRLLDEQTSAVGGGIEGLTSFMPFSSFKGFASFGTNTPSFDDAIAMTATTLDPVRPTPPNTAQLEGAASPLAGHSLPGAHLSIERDNKQGDERDDAVVAEILPGVRRCAAHAFDDRFGPPMRSLPSLTVPFAAARQVSAGKSAAGGQADGISSHHGGPAGDYNSGATVTTPRQPAAAVGAHVAHHGIKGVHHDAADDGGEDVSQAEDLGLMLNHSEEDDDAMYTPQFPREPSYRHGQDGQVPEYLQPLPHVEQPAGHQAVLKAGCQEQHQDNAAASAAITTAAATTTPTAATSSARTVAYGMRKSFSSDHNALQDAAAAGVSPAGGRDCPTSASPCMGRSSASPGLPLDAAEDAAAETAGQAANKLFGPMVGGWF